VKKRTNFRSLFESLLNRKLTARDGMAEKPNWPAMPGKLREFYRIAGRVDSINRIYERLYRPTRMDDEGGYRIFMEENQNVVLWAFRIEDADQENPTIYQASCLESDKLGKWYPQKLLCSEWLVAMAYWQVVNGGFRFGGFADGQPDLRRRLAAHWPHILTIPEGSIAFYGRGGQLVCWCGNNGDLYAAGRTKADFRHIVKTLRIDWSYSDLAEYE
jgi:hypothetical protein